MNYVYLSLAILFNVSSYAVYKSISQRPHSAIWYLFFAAGLALGAINVLFFTKSLKTIPLNVAYPVFSGSCILAVAIVSTLVFGERLGGTGMTGAILVIAGITFLLV